MAGLGIVEIAGDGEEFRGAQVMCGKALLGGRWSDFNHAHRSGLGFDGTVDEEYGFRLGDVLGEVGSPLLAGDYADCGIVAEFFFGPLSEPGADAVVAAEGVAAG